MTGRLRAYIRSFTGFERDARMFLLATFVSGAAISLYWTDFNLYLAAIGIERSTIGIIASTFSLAGAIVAFPASGLSDRIGRRAVLIGGVALMIVATAGFIATSSALLIGCLVALYGAGQQAFFVVQAPYMTERSRPDQRSELFSLQFAIVTGTNVLALTIGGATAQAVGSALGLAPGDAGVYRIVLVMMMAALVLTLGTLALLRDDRPHRRSVDAPSLRALGEPAAFPHRPRGRGVVARLGITVVDRGRFARLVLPGFIISLGAGQIIPFLNLFVEGKFGLDLASLNLVFAFTSLGTMVAILIQPALAHRMGKVGSVVVVQAASLPFLFVLGFSPVLWSVVIAMAVRNSLMNAGNPIATAFAMEHVHPSERATMSAAQSELWSLGWVIAGVWYAVWQAVLGFDGGYTVAFITVITLYSIGTFLYWHWFHGVEARERSGSEALAGAGQAGAGPA